METVTPVVNNETIVPESPKMAPQDHSNKKRNSRFDRNKRDNKDAKEQKGDKKPSRNKQLYEQWEKELTITLETPLPELPKEKLEEPNNKELRETLTAIDKEINAKRDMIVKLKVEKTESIEKDRKLRDQNRGDLKGLFSQVKELNNEIGDLNGEKKLLEIDIEKLSKQKDTIVKGIFGKKLMKVSDCERKIEDLNYRQQTERLTATAEREILKDLNELNKSLPMIKEAEAKETEMKEVKDKKKVLGKKIHSLIEQKNKLNADIDLAKEAQKAKEGEKAEEKKEVKEEKTKHPISIKIDGVKSEIDALRQKKTELKDEHEKKYQAWKDQNTVELKIKFIKKRKAILQKKKEEEEYYAAIKAEEDRIKAEKEEYERVYGKPKKYQPQINQCSQLITYLNTIMPKATEVSEEQAMTFDQENVQSKLAEGDWKKEKVYIHKKTEDWNEGVQPGQKKKGKKSKKQAQAKPEDVKLTLTIETMSAFEEIRCSPPVYQKEIAEALKQLEEKMNYFIRISDELNEGKTVDEEAANEVVEKDNKREKRQKVNLDDDQMFPVMGM